MVSLEHLVKASFWTPIFRKFGFVSSRSAAYTFCNVFSTQGTPLSLIVNLDVADEVILSRISDRWVHLPSGRVYNLSYNPPKVAGHDDETGEPLTKRPDDNPVRMGCVS